MARAYQIPHSQLLSWDKSDRDKAIWMHVRSQQACSGCGTRSAEWDPEQGGSRAAYLAAVRHCPGCQQVAARQDQLVKQHDGKAPRGYHVYLKHNET